MAISARSSGRARTVRLAVVQGPIQALTACAAIAHAERRWGAGYRNVLLFGGVLADDRSTHYAVVREASLACVGAIEWAGLLELVKVPDVPSLRKAVATYGEVAEVICCRNWQPVNEIALSAFPKARRIVVGDGLGVIDTGLAPGEPRFHLALPIIPLPLTEDALAGTELEVVPRQRLLEMIAAARERTPGIRELDRTLAEFAHGGLLLLMNYMTEAYDATLRSEIGLSRYVARSARRGSGQPIVVKPHPRSSLGQAAALARLLRAEGHPVRIMGQFEFGHYPIELFECLIRAVDSIQAQGSTSALSIRYLYGVPAAANLPRRQVRRAVLPRQRRRFNWGLDEAARILDALNEWDGRSPVLVNTLPDFGFVERVAGRLTRPITWNPAGAWRRRTRPWRIPPLPEPVVRQLGDSHPQKLADSANGIVWLLGRRDRESADGIQLPDPSGSPRARVSDFLDRLSRAPGAHFGAVVAVTPSTHAPGWQGWWRRLAGVAVVEGASMSAENFEDLLETKADVLLRLPEIGSSLGRRRNSGPRWRLPPGFVAFVFRMRPGGSRQSTAVTSSAISRMSSALSHQSFVSLENRNAGGSSPPVG